MPTQTGPLTKDPSRLALGLAQIRIQASATSISNTSVAIGSSATEMMGAMASTKLTIEREFFTHEAGFPLLQDAQLPIRENASLECAFEEIDGYNMNIAAGNLTTSSGELAMGAMVSPTYVRMEAHYTYPNGRHMYIIFPRAQVISNTEIDFQKEENASVTLTFKATRADDGISPGGHANWNAKPLGRIYWDF